MRHGRFLLAISMAFTTISLPLVAGEALARPTYVNEDVADAAASGYDVVSYFNNSGSPQKGSDKFAAQYDGVTYWFANTENAATFKANPTAFAPQYGGHCAWAMSRGSLAPGDPTFWKIVDNKLYFNFSQQVQKTWLGDVPGFIKKADTAWPTVPEDAKFGE